VNTIKLLRSHNAVIVVLVVALLAQMPHAQDVFYRQGHAQTWFGWVASIFAAVALEIAVLVFVVRGNIRASWGFAAFSVAINLIYYADAQSAWYMPNPSWLLSAGLPIAIALYSHEVAEPVHDAKTTVQDDAQPSYAIVQSENDIVHDDIDPKYKAAQLKSEGFSNTEIATMMGVHRNTISAYLRQPLHTNGYHKEE
jgi:hypothetical protein